MRRAVRLLSLGSARFGARRWDSSCWVRERPWLRIRFLLLPPLPSDRVDEHWRACADSRLRETKAGEQLYEDRVVDQVAKDSAMRAAGFDVEWHFVPSSRGGPFIGPRLIEALEVGEISIVLHLPR